MKRKKKAPGIVKLVYLVSQFGCGQCGNEVEKEVEAVQGPGTATILDKQEMDIRCAKCGWEGKLLGKSRLKSWEPRPPRVGSF